MDNNTLNPKKDYDMDNATLVLLIDSKLDEYAGRSLVDGAEVVDFLLDLRSAAVHRSITEEDKEFSTN